MKNNLKEKDHTLYVSTDSDFDPVDDWDIYDSNGETDLTVTEDTDTNGNITISDSSYDLSGSIQIDSRSGTVSFDGPDSEEIERRKKVSKNQLEKVRKLIDSILETVGESKLNHSEIERCKSDLRRIRDMEHTLENGIQKAEMFNWNWNSGAILDPDQLETLNDIYRRWT